MIRSKKLKRKKVINIVAIAAILVVVIGGYLLMNYTSLGTPTGEEKEFTITAFQWGFEPQFIEVNQGDLVTLHVTSMDVTHGIAIDAFNINEPLLPNNTVTMSFVADKIGTFNFYCSVVCGAGHSDQKGFLIVKDPMAPQPEPVKLVTSRVEQPIQIDGIIEDAWDTAAESIFTTVFQGEGKQIKVKTLTDGEKIFLLARWFDNDQNDDGTTETDRIAVQFDVSGTVDIAMGAAGVPHIKQAQQTIGRGVVDIWHWKAFDSHSKKTNVIDDEFAGPFEQLKEHYYRDDDNLHGGNNDLIAQGVYDANSKEWIVEISRPLVTGDTDIPEFGIIDKQLSLGKSYSIAFAVWDGGRGETAGQHRVTDWGVLEIQ